MEFIKERSKRIAAATSLTAAVIATAVTACGGGGGSSLLQGAAPGQWTQTEVSQFTAAGGTGGSSSQDSCIIGYFERDMSFGNAMAVASVAPPSSSESNAQIESAVLSKYGTNDGSTINTQFEKVISDAAVNC
jgi:hypothetical protein